MMKIPDISGGSGDIERGPEQTPRRTPRRSEDRPIAFSQVMALTKRRRRKRNSAETAARHSSSQRTGSPRAGTTSSGSPQAAGQAPQHGNASSATPSMPGVPGGAAPSISTSGNVQQAAARGSAGALDTLARTAASGGATAPDQVDLQQRIAQAAVSAPLISAAHLTAAQLADAPAMTTSQAADRIADEASTMSRQEDLRELVIRLEPEHLGPIEVTIEVHRGRITARIRAHRAEAAEILSRDGDKLRDRLAALGYSQAHVEIEQVDENVI